MADVDGAYHDWTVPTRVILRISEDYEGESVAIREAFFDHIGHTDLQWKDHVGGAANEKWHMTLDLNVDKHDSKPLADIPHVYYRVERDGSNGPWKFKTLSHVTMRETIRAHITQTTPFAS